jgi:hypothetical protein
MRLACLTTLCCAALSGACATEYKPESAVNQGGYTETKRGPGVWQVWFVSKDLATQDQSDDFALLRGAELCLAENKPFMRTSKFDSRAAIVGTKLPPFARGPTEVAGPLPGSSELQYTRRVLVNPQKYSYKFFSSVEVTCLAEKSEDAQDTAAVADEIRRQYRVDPPRSPG